MENLTMEMETQTEALTTEVEVETEKKAEAPEAKREEVQAPKKKSRRKKKKSASDDLDIDFENYSVDADRAEKIRSLVNLVKEENLVEGLSTLVKELGQIEESESQQNGEFAPIKYKKGQEPRVYEPLCPHPCFGFKLRSEVNVVEIYWGTKLLLEVSMLPKEKDYIVQYVDETLWDEIAEKLKLLNFEIKDARKIKVERQKKWQSRFKKK